MAKLRDFRIMSYLAKKSTRLALVMSMGAIILVFSMSTAGSFSYLSVKKSMALVVDESPTDFVIVQKDYGPKATQSGPQIPPRFVGDLINSTTNVENLIILTLRPDYVSSLRIYPDNSGYNERICVIGLWTRGPTNFTLSEGSNPDFSLERRQDTTLQGMLVSDDLFQKYNLSIGTTIRIDRWNGARQRTDWEMRDTVKGVVKLTLDQVLEELTLQDVAPLVGLDKERLVALNQYPFVIARLSAISFSLPFEKTPCSYFVKFAKEAYMNPWDTGVTTNNLENLGEDLWLNLDNASSGIIGQDYSVAWEKHYPTITSLEEMSHFIQMNIVTIFALGITTAIVGWHFYGTLSKTAVIAKKEDFYLLHIRGASYRRILASMTVLAIVASLIGTTVGLGLGFLATTLLAPSTLDMSVSSDDLAMAYGWPSLLSYSCFGIAASLLSHRNVVSEMKGHGLIQELNKPTDKKRSLATIMIPVVAFALGLAKTAEWIVGFKVFRVVQTTNPITSALFMLMNLIDRTVLDVLGAVFLAYALVTLLSMYPSILSAAAHAVSSALASRISLLSKKLMQSKSPKMVGSMIVTSLLVFNIVAAHMGYAGTRTAWTTLSTAIVGADIRIDVQEEATPQILQTLSNVAGVENYTQVLLAEAEIGAPLGGVATYIIETTEYITVVGRLDTSLANALNSLKDGEIIVSDFFSGVGALSISDSVTLGHKELKVIGFIQVLPGTLSVPALEKFVVVNARAFEDVNYAVLSRTVLVEVAGQAPESVVIAIGEDMPESMRQSYTIATAASALTEFSQKLFISQIGENIMMMLLLTNALSFLFAVAAVGIMAYNDAKERRSLDALLRIRGVTRPQLTSLILSEALTFFLISLLVGSFAGFAMASSYTAYFSATFPIRALPSVSFELPLQLLLFLAVYLFVFLTPSICAMRKPIRTHAN